MFQDNRPPNEEILAVKCFNCDAYIGRRDYGWCYTFEMFLDGNTVCVRWANSYASKQEEI